MNASSDHASAINDLVAAFGASNKIDRSAPSDTELRDAVGRLVHLAEGDCSGTDDLLRILPAVIGRHGMANTTLDAQNSLALLHVIHCALAGGRGHALAPLEKFLPDERL